MALPENSMAPYVKLWLGKSQSMVGQVSTRHPFDGCPVSQQACNLGRVMNCCLPKWSSTPWFRQQVCLLCWSWNQMYWGKTTEERAIDMPVGKAAITWEEPRKEEGPRGSQGSNNKGVGMAITLPQKNPRQYSCPTGFLPAFPSVGDTDARSLLAFPNQTTLQKAFELRDDERCQLGGRGCPQV